MKSELQDSNWHEARRGDDGVCVIDPSGRIVAADAAAAGWLGRRPDQTTPQGGALADLIGPGPAAACFQWFRQPPHEAILETELISTEGVVEDVAIRLRRLDGDGGPLALLSFHRNPSEAVLVHDALTGLPDRRAVAERIAAWRREELGAPGPFAVLFLDLDNFKSVNDRHGHAAGDRVLRELAERWVKCVREGDLVARYGGDEFVVLLRDVANALEAEPAVWRLEQATREPVDLGQLQLHVTATVGVAIAGNVDAATEDLIAAADRDMYARKRRGAE